MATYNKGILGVFSGKVGTVIGSSWKGIDYMRSLPKAGTRTPSEKQVVQQAKFAMVTRFFKSIKDLIAVGYKDVKGSITPYNEVVSYHLKETVNGDYPDFEINYPKMIFSRGQLPGVARPSLTANSGATFTLTWEDNSTANLASGNDRAIILAYQPASKEFVCLDTVVRAAMNANLELPDHFIDTEVQVWMAFFAPDASLVSTSVYVGSATVLA